MTRRPWTDLLLAGFLCIAVSCGAEGGSQEVKSGVQHLPVFEQWAGTGSSYPGSPVYQMIRRLEELQQFWELHKVSDPMPHINFETCMLFIWAPGPSRFDYRPLQVLEFRREPQGLFLILGLDRKDTGGFWRGPFLMAILPKLAGHVSVVRPGRKHLREAVFMPMATIYDMGGELMPISETVVGKVPGAGKSSSGATSGGGTPVPTAPASTETTASEKPSGSETANSGSGSSVAAGTSTGQATDLGLGADTAKKTDSKASDSGDPFNIDF